MHSGTPLLVALLIAPVLAGCRSSEFDAIPDPALLERARSQVSSEDEDELEEAAGCAEALLERSVESEVVQEALVLAAEAQLALGEFKAAYRHYEALMQDYPYSNFLPRVERPVYELGIAYIQREPWWLFKDLFSGRPFGVEVLRQFAATFPFSESADDALMRMAEYFESREEYDLAADKYGMVEERYPSSEWYERAAYLEGRCHQRQSRGAGYDDKLLRQARRCYLDFLARDDLVSYREDVRIGLRETEEALAEGELMVADFYLLREQPQGARIHLANVVLAFPGTPAAVRARQVLEENGWDLSMNSLDTLQGRIEE